MRHRIVAIWRQVSGSLWFVPGLIVLVGVVLAAALVQAQTLVEREALQNFPRLFGAGAESSRGMVATIAGSVITVAGVTFSITMVAVTQASSQYTPRVLRNFMRDRVNQVVLGVFVGIFAYCLVVILTIRSDDDLRFVPSIAVLGAFVLALVGMGFLIYFIHHVADALQASSILARVAGETARAVDRLFPDELGDAPGDQDAEPQVSRAADALRESTWISVPALASGYVESVDTDGLMRFAEERRVVVRMERGIGEFVIEATPLASLAAPDGHDLPDVPDAARALGDLFTIVPHRTIDQDAAFGVRQIVDIALKALSPSSNDSTTAVNCVDYLGAVLVRAARRRIEDPYRVSSGELRVIARGPTFATLAALALDEVRRNAAGNVRVLVHMLHTLQTVAAAAPRPRRAVLRTHVSLIRSTADTGDMPAEDRARIAAAYESALAALDDAGA